MGKMLGYMLTWTTYGSWLQGEKKGYVKGGKVLGENPGLKKTNVDSQAGDSVKLTGRQREIVRNAIVNEAKRLDQKIHSLVVCSNHVHLVVGYISDPISEAAGYYKNAARVALRRSGFAGKV